MASNPHNALIQGSWATSYSGWMHVLPKPQGGTQPPQIGGYDYFPNGDHYKQREGYFVIAGWACYKFDGNGNLTGRRDLNRGGPDFIADTPLTGEYAITANTTLDAYHGTFRTRHLNTAGDYVDNYYSFVMTSDDELEWLWTNGKFQTGGDAANPVMSDSAYRALVAQGTLRRVKLQP
jgi:hypothetical protein